MRERERSLHNRERRKAEQQTINGTVTSRSLLILPADIRQFENRMEIEDEIDQFVLRTAAYLISEGNPRSRRALNEIVCLHRGRIMCAVLVYEHKHRRTLNKTARFSTLCDLQYVE